MEKQHINDTKKQHDPVEKQHLDEDISVDSGKADQVSGGKTQH